MIQTYGWRKKCGNVQNPFANLWNVQVYNSVLCPLIFKEKTIELAQSRLLDLVLNSTISQVNHKPACLHFIFIYIRDAYQIWAGVG